MFRKNDSMRIAGLGVLAIVLMLIAPAAFARHVGYSVGIYGPGYGINYSSCHRCGYGYAGYYAPGYYSPAYYSYPSYGTVYYEEPVVVHHVYREEVRYYDDDDSYYRHERSHGRHTERASYYYRGD